MSEERPNPDELLAKVQADAARSARGKLKIFFGMAPGVGKTYAMLEGARKVAKEGVDVIVGYVEPHARPETHALVMGLDLIPRRLVHYKGKAFEEFDLEGALARKPQLILVDELAHTNAEGSTHAKRWQDVEDLLAAGIDVYSTLNVQHLESLNDVIAQVTSIPVRETIPDSVFEEADEIELVDLSPDDLIERLKEGKVYVPQQAMRAIENFFRKGNLIALRELALRKTAERVGEQTLDYRLEHNVQRIWPTSERLLVCVGPSPSSGRLVRAARRMAVSLRAPLTALHVDLDGQAALSTSDQERLEQNLRLAEELGAKVDHTSGGKFAESVVEYARRNNITRIVVGKPQLSRWREFWRGAFVYELIRLCGDIDVYVISGDHEPARVSQIPRKRERESWIPYAGAAVSVGVCSVLCFGLWPWVAATNLVMIYLSCVVAVALFFGRGPSILATMLSVAIFDLSFIPPYGTLVVSDSQYLLTFVVMLATGLIISELMSRVRFQTAAARQREARTAALFALSRELVNLPTIGAVAQVARRIVGEALESDVWVVVPDMEGRLVSADPQPEIVPPAKDEGVIKWVFDRRQIAGAGTETLPGAESTYVPLIVTEGIAGVLGIRRKGETKHFTTQQLHLLQAFTAQIASAVERCNLEVEAEKIRLQVETERLRNSLLSSVSHDLRTPLAGINGAASLLVEGEEKLTIEARHELAQSILDETDRLHRLVANLLDLTRLEAGAIEVHRELQPIDEVIGVALGRLERQLRDHPVETQLGEDLPPVPIDGLLIQQVLLNLLDNAAKFSPANAPITLSARRDGRNLWVEVADRGPGLPQGEEQRIFEKFYQVRGSARAGSGIGLAICRGIVELHGGVITAAARAGGGAVFRFSLPLEAEMKNSTAPLPSQEVRDPG